MRYSRLTSNDFDDSGFDAEHPPNTDAADNVESHATGRGNVTPAATYRHPVPEGAGENDQTMTPDTSHTIPSRANDRPRRLLPSLLSLAGNVLGLFFTSEPARSGYAKIQHEDGTATESRAEELSSGAKRVTEPTVRGEPVHACAACTDDFPISLLRQLECSHEYCGPCLGRIFHETMRDISRYPPRCCRQPISLALVKALLPADIAETFEKKAPELDTKDRTYCHKSECEAWIPPVSIHGRRAVCQACAGVTCVECKQLWHHGSCATLLEDQQQLRYAKAQGWQRCGKCGFLVELASGCYHMTCLCGFQFCYCCGQFWKTCSCPSDDLFFRRRPGGPAHSQNRPGLHIERVEAQTAVSAHTAEGWVADYRTRHPYATRRNALAPTSDQASIMSSQASRAEEIDRRRNALMSNMRSWIGSNTRQPSSATLGDLNRRQHAALRGPQPSYPPTYRSEPISPGAVEPTLRANGHHDTPRMGTNTEGLVDTRVSPADPDTQAMNASRTPLTAPGRATQQLLQQNRFVTHLHIHVRDHHHRQDIHRRVTLANREMAAHQEREAEQLGMRARQRLEREEERERETRELREEIQRRDEAWEASRSVNRATSEEMGRSSARREHLERVSVGEELRFSIRERERERERENRVLIGELDVRTARGCEHTRR
ncbi:hypothetical protein CAC42_4119 [Sphaceloma murrayae]|uniref:RBR-type E3 ubiquitin transferase n=1 Tax=Sphaceloma murrayae TaxID=2082308 RepID=A0A2K1QKK3_9PEZI|nr:hypothetical protein CAC42_4119 [Sphaceloma murrayae]